jgi:oligopeptide/dipeptide ABC transporter ATP-binding protein
MVPLIEAVDVSKRFPGGLGRESTLALAGLSLAIHAETPSIIAVVGESGSGKTTLARLLLGLAEPSSGEIRYRGTDLRKLDRAGRRAFRHDVQAVFQDPYGVYNPFYRVDHVLATPLRCFRLAASRAQARQLIHEALRAVGLQPEEILGRFPHQLSGGQRQRIMVARALLLRPKLIVADEPVSMVDASLRATILGSLRQLTDEHGISVLYITHDLATAYQVSDTILVLYITHDLATAYQVSDSILVLYRAHLAEAGAVERVVGAPGHPYTQLLVSAIPRAHAARDWLEQEERSGMTGVASTAAGCCFADRCPVAMPACLSAPPGLYRTEPRRAVACVQYQDCPTMPPGDPGAVLSPRGVSSGHSRSFRDSAGMRFQRS